MMKKIFSVIAGLAISAMPAVLNAEEAMLPLDGKWQFRQAGTSVWHDAEVPGCVHLDLMAAGLVPDPFVSRNEKDLQWIGEKDWEYARTFNVDGKILENEHVELRMEGLDTYADVYVNDRLVRTCDNMFRTWIVDVKPYIHEGENEIRICFSSVFKVDMPKYLAAPFKLRAWPNNDQNSDIWLSLYARKAGYNYGWDWGPRLITTGIWRSIGIRAWSGVDVGAVHVKTLSIPEKASGNASMQADCLINSDFDGDADLTVSWEDRKVSRKVSLQKGENRVLLDFNISRPRLWWCNGAGNQELYHFTVSASGAGHEDTL